MNPLKPNIEIEDFSGPLDLLLQLVQKSEIDLRQVKLCDIMQQFLQCLAQFEETRIENGSELVSSASFLLLLKSQRLLPQNTQNEEEIYLDDLRLQTLNQLLDYYRFKDLAKLLSAQEENYQKSFKRGVISQTLPKIMPKISLPLDIQELMHVMNQALLKISQRPSLTIDEPQWKLADVLQHLKNLVKDKAKVSITSYLNTTVSYTHLIISFLAILELLKRGDTKMTQELNELFLTS